MDLAVKERNKFGKGVKALRGEGFIPAELYGRGVGNIHISVSQKDFDKIFKEAGESTVINLSIDGDRRPVLIHDIQRDFLSGEIVHVDFYQVKMDEKIKARIPLEFAGESPAVKEFGGILNKTISAIEVEALPGDLPRHLEVDVSGLKELNQSFYASNLSVPNGVKILVEPETVIATVTPPVEEEKIEEAAPVDVSAVKVETEEKAAERPKEKEETGEKEKKE